MKRLLRQSYSSFSVKTDSLFMNKQGIQSLLAFENPLIDVIKKEIEEKGPMSFSRYLSLALTHKEYGYYMNQNVFNTDGDFITSPEISQLFGEMIGLWFVVFCEKKEYLGTEKTLVEIGPGTGSLMTVIVNTFRQLQMLEGLTINMIEVSPFLRKLQQKTLNELLLNKDILMEFAEEDDKPYEEIYNEELGFRIRWFSSFDQYKDFDLKNDNTQPHLFLCHEFFDALPHHKFKYKNGNWHEIMIDKKRTLLEEVSGIEKLDKNHFEEVLSEKNTESVSSILKPEYRFSNTKEREGQEIEVCPIGILIRLIIRKRHCREDRQN